MDLHRHEHRPHGDAGGDHADNRKSITLKGCDGAGRPDRGALVYYDQVAFMNQLGLLPEAAAAS
jgi:hypothetical protein